MHEVALVLDHSRRARSPFAIDAGVTVRSAVGAGCSGCGGGADDVGRLRIQCQRFESRFAMLGRNDCKEKLLAPDV